MVFVYKIIIFHLNVENIVSRVAHQQKKGTPGIFLNTIALSCQMLVRVVISSTALLRFLFSPVLTLHQSLVVRQTAVQTAGDSSEETISESNRNQTEVKTLVHPEGEGHIRSVILQCFRTMSVWLMDIFTYNTTQHSTARTYTHTYISYLFYPLIDFSQGGYMPI